MAGIAGLVLGVALTALAMSGSETRPTARPSPDIPRGVRTPSTLECPPIDCPPPPACPPSDCEPGDDPAPAEAVEPANMPDPTEFAKHHDAIHGVTSIPEMALAPRDWGRYADRLEDEAAWAESLDCGVKKALYETAFHAHIQAYRTSSFASGVREPARIEVGGQRVDPHLVRAAMIQDAHGGELFDREMEQDLDALRGQLGEDLPSGDLCTPMPE